MDDKEKLQQIFNTEKDIDIPFLRQKDWNWLSRNFCFKNKNHPKKDEVMNLLKNILKEEYLKSKLNSRK